MINSVPILAQVYHLPSLFFPMALQPVEWGLWKQRAREFVELHPTVRGVDLTRGERLVTPGARETFAVVTHRREAQVRALGGQPCCRCGCWTACWCEGCSVQPPVALCTERDKADKDHLLCQDRVAQNKLLAEVQHQTAPADKGAGGDGDRFVRIDPPIVVPLEQIPVAEDGVFDLASLVQQLRPDLK